MFSPRSRSRRSPARRQPSLPRLPLLLEALEDRTVPSAGWAVNQPDSVWDVAVAQNGTVYATGTFSGTADFDPGPGTTLLTSTSGNDGYVSAFGPDGTFLWATRCSDSDPHA